MADPWKKSANGDERGRESPRLLVIGCGNPMAGDDSAGVEIVRRLEAAGSGDCRLLALAFPDVGLLEKLPSADVLLFVDAVSSGSPPGTVHVLALSSPQVEQRVMSTLSNHGWGVAEILELARALGRRVPRVMLLGVEVEGVLPGTPRSQPIESALAFVVDQFPHLRQQLLDPESPVWHSLQHISPLEQSFSK